MSNTDNKEEFLPNDTTLRSYKLNEKHHRYNTYVSIVEAATDIFKQSSVDIKKQCVKIIALLSTEYLDILDQNPQLAKSLSVKIDDLITNHNMVELIPIYNLIYNSNKYKDIQAPELLLSTEITDKLLEEYHAPLPVITHTKPKYTIGEIIGAKDKEGNWWMSEVLFSTSYNAHTIYYIKFLNWGDQFNEFIYEKHRLQRYNPYKHKYYRSASELANIYSESD